MNTWNPPLGLGVTETNTLSPAELAGEREDALRAMWGGDASAVFRAAFADVARWGPRRPTRRLDGGGDAFYSVADWQRWHVVIPVRGAHEALEVCLRSLAGLEDADTFDVTIVCQAAEADAVWAVIDRSTINVNLTRVVATADPWHFAVNCNEAIEDFWFDRDAVVFLNSDCDVTPIVSLRGAFAVALSHADAVGPAGSNVSGFQNFGPERGATWGRLDRRKMPSVSTLPYPRLVGFCLAVRLSAFRAVGGWDESFVNAYDDDDLSLRLALRSEAGRPSLLWCPSALVLHEGSASFREMPDARANYDRTLDENRRRFEARWGWAAGNIHSWWRTV